MCQSNDLHKQGDAGVGHSVGQTQDAAAHDGVPQVEDGHAKGSSALVLRGKQRLYSDETMDNCGGATVNVLGERRSSYIFRLILLLAQVVFREEFLTLCLNITALKADRREKALEKRTRCMRRLCMFSGFCGSVSPGRELLLVGVFLRRDVSHFSFSSVL